MNCCRETTKMGVPPGNRKVLVSVPGWYVAGADSRERQEGRPYYSRSLRSAQSRTASGICDKRVPSFVVAASNS